MALASRLSKLVLKTQSKNLICRHFAALSKPLVYWPKNTELSRRTIYDKDDKSHQMGGDLMKISLGVGVACALIAIAKNRYEIGKQKNNILGSQIDVRRRDPSIKDYLVTEEIPEWKVARSIRTTNDNTKIKFTLFQYQTCPFCCKTRAFLDYFGLNYDVIEVNSVTRKQMKWSKKYKKVPVLVAELENGQKYQLVDSTAIISTLYSLIYDKTGGLEDILKFYPQYVYENESKKPVMEISNRYSLMFQESTPPKDNKGMAEEKKWRKWADDTLVHTLSPNVYRTPNEALQAFQWFDKVGDWERHFATWERYLVIYVGAAVMWCIGKNLKKKHMLKDDVRQSLYDQVNVWLKAIKAKGTTFMGGSQPDLADLAVYGVLSAIEGCDTFQELLQKTKVGAWYNAMKEACSIHKGQTILK